jgi:hypothetical protein
VTFTSERDELIQTGIRKKTVREECPWCGEEITHIAPDALDWCSDCERITEGNTIIVEEEHG